ncbi:hypothetical protein [Mitsuaria sp. GD03876]|uniref:hypothetical protein n=1 Tax=Mitsuaria sp. GD03876 TaxID=2975399 RepID=UPI00244B5E45|nr:hypothetical protein [Mitsuaria sp. GD03876]MDH0867046.1 hypothetical protein [Mitsuaria sp. GD03876]
MTSISFKHLVAASAHFHRLVRARLVTDDGLAHAQTQILGAARLAGLLMFRSFRVDTQRLAPGMRVASDEARLHGTTLRDVLLATLHQLGHPVAEDDLDGHCQTAALSRLAFFEVHERLTRPALSYLELSPMGVRDAAVAAATAAAGLIHDHAPAMPVRQAAALACFGFEEGVTTVPWPLAPTPRAMRPLGATAFTHLDLAW